MRKKLCIGRNFALAILLFLISCRNEDFSNSLTDSKREEEFFREALSKTASLKNGSSIVEAFKEQNEKSHFVSKMKDQSGLPIWDKMLTLKKTKTANKGESGDGSEQYIIPLTENEKDLSSILYVTKYPDDSFTFSNIDNERLKQEVFNPQIDKDYREQLLLSFIIADNLSFAKDAVYWNIPDDLLSLIPQSTIYPQRRFTATVNTSENGGSTNDLNDVIICVTYEVECPVCDEGAHPPKYNTACFAGSTGGYGGGLGDGGGGDTGGNPGGNNGGGDSGGGGGGLPTGDPGNNDDCNSPNKTFYKIVPGCDDDLPAAVQSLKIKLENYEYYISSYTGFLSDNIAIANKFNTYLDQNNNESGAQFVFWGLGFLSQNPDTTWAQFENWFVSGNLTASQMNEFISDLYNPDIVKPTKRFKNHAKINSIFNQAKTAANFKQYLKNFEPTFSVAHLLFDVGPVNNSAALAQTREPLKYWVKITFNQNWDYSNTPKIVIAYTFMHEMIHAEMFRKLLSISSTPQGNINWDTVTSLLNTDNYPGLFDYYTRFLASDSDIDHQMMGAHYINIVVNFLKQIYSNQYSDIEYKAIAWSGARETKAWNLLSAQEKQLYIDTWNQKYWTWEK